MSGDGNIVDLNEFRTKRRREEKSAAKKAKKKQAAANRAGHGRSGGDKKAAKREDAAEAKRLEGHCLERRNASEDPNDEGGDESA